MMLPAFVANSVCVCRSLGNKGTFVGFRERAAVSEPNQECENAQPSTCVCVCAAFCDFMRERERERAWDLYANCASTYHITKSRRATPWTTTTTSMRIYSCCKPHIYAKAYTAGFRVYICNELHQTIYLRRRHSAHICSIRVGKAAILASKTAQAFSLRVCPSILLMSACWWGVRRGLRTPRELGSLRKATRGDTACDADCPERAHRHELYVEKRTACIPCTHDDEKPVDGTANIQGVPENLRDNPLEEVN